MNGNGRYRTQSHDMAASFSGLTHDVIELSELQTQLFMLDVKTSSQRTRTCLILGIVGACLLLGTIPVTLIALAELLVGQLGWSRAAGFGVAALVGSALSGIFAGAAWGVFKNGLLSLERSRDELNRNIAWIKSTLRTRGQRPAAENPWPSNDIHRTAER